MQSRPRLSRVPLWERHQNYVLDVLREALHGICRNPPEDLHENSINRQLYIELKEANFRRLQIGKGSVAGTIPYWECPVQPSIETINSVSEFKRPDFTWGFQDGSASSADTSDRHFVIECKRLGVPANSWNFNRNYVNHGVRRFIDTSHRYGANVPSGAMVGYVQSSTVDTIRKEVNGEGSASGIPFLSEAEESSWGHVEHTQSLERGFEPVDFKLYHLWGDLRPYAVGLTELKGS